MYQTYHLPPGSDVPMQNWNPMLHVIHCVSWTDGHHFNPYLHRRVEGLMRRPSDGFVFWEDDALDLGWGAETKPVSRPYWEEEPEDAIVCLIPKEWKNLEFVEAATEEDYFRALSSGLASTRERELYIRKRLLRIHNHPVRFGEYLADSSRHYANREALLTMLSPKDPDELLLMIELHREARDIDKARALLIDLELDEGDYIVHKAKKIQELCYRAISEVSVWDGKIGESQPVWEHYRGV